MSATPVLEEFDFESARRAVLRYRPGSNWLSMVRDPTQHMTIGFGFDLSRAESPDMLRAVGLDPTAVRSGRTPITDAQMNELFDLTLLAAVELACRRVPEFAHWRPEQQWALLELIVWLGRDGTAAVFSELEELSLALTAEPPEPSPWFDVGSRSASARRASAGAQTVRSADRGAPRDPGARVPAAGCQTTFESFGLVAEMVSDDPGLHQAAQAMLPPGWRVVDAEPSVGFGVWSDGVITVNGARVDGTTHRGRALLKLGAVVRHRVATATPTFTFVHAGVVEVGGCGIVIPGRSYTGKSTLVAELVRLGATYVSDEYAVLDSRGVVQPFAKPLSIRNGRDDPLGQLVHVPQDRVAEHPVRTGLIVLTGYRPGGTWQPSRRSSAQGAFALLQNTVSARLRPRRAFNATTRLARGAVFLVGQRGEASETARALLDLALRRSDGSNTFLP